LDFGPDCIPVHQGYVKTLFKLSGEQAGSIYLIALVDTFVENFSNYSVYTRYKEAYNTVVGSDADELVLKAVFLFYAGDEKLTKPEGRTWRNSVNPDWLAKI